MARFLLLEPEGLRGIDGEDDVSEEYGAAH